MLKVSSPKFGHTDAIPARYTCDGDDINPPLCFSGIPETAKSLALIVDDPDAPSGTWVHWLVWNIDPAASRIVAASVPVGAKEGLTSFGRSSYGGPCPPSGIHRYYFKLYALDCELELYDNADKDLLMGAMKGHVIEEAELMGIYGRK